MTRSRRAGAVQCHHDLVPTEFLSMHACACACSSRSSPVLSYWPPIHMSQMCTFGTSTCVIVRLISNWLLVIYNLFVCIVSWEFSARVWHIKINGMERKQWNAVLPFVHVCCREFIAFSEFQFHLVYAMTRPGPFKSSGVRVLFVYCCYKCLDFGLWARGLILIFGIRNFCRSWRRFEKETINFCGSRDALVLLIFLLM